MPITTPVVETFVSTSLRPAGHGAVREQPLAGAEDDGEHPQVELVDEVVAQQGLDQVAAAVDLELRTVALLERGDRLARVAIEVDDGAPVEHRLAARRDVLGGVVERLGAVRLGGVGQ